MEHSLIVCPYALIGSDIPVVEGTIASMSIKEIESTVLKLQPRDRARLAEKLLESLEDLSEQENEAIWSREAERRDASWSAADSKRTAKKVLRSVRAKLK
jgi:hypothetical protein